MEQPSLERLVIVLCSGIQSIVYTILIHSIMSNTQPVGLGLTIGWGTALGLFLSLCNLALCSTFGSSTRVLQVCKVAALLPLVVFGAMFAVAFVAMGPA